MDKIALISGSLALLLLWLIVRFLQGSRERQPEPTHTLPSHDKYRRTHKDVPPERTGA